MLTYCILVPVIMLTALVYASVGLGGGTAYLSIVSFWNSDPTTLRPMAWSLNIVASSAAFWNFRRQGHFDARLAWPFLVGGVLGATIGGAIQVEKAAFQAMLAIALICASLQMLLAKGKPGTRSSRKPPVLPSLFVGTTIGIISGLVGIGGGIVLGPVLVALGWVDMKTLAPITSLYILLNSSAALTSFLLTGGNIDLPLTGVFCVAVLAGGFIGSRWGAEKASESKLRRVFGIVALVAGVKLSYEYLRLMGG
ncbi:MAG: sulfite exporter TauE/SafE family protein [Candidatus Nealsonbacteria bacterium]|nr:sulfite exporter TauE/SafE family protein [Candidatus Nealsonbacteria bacterium]